MQSPDASCVEGEDAGCSGSNGTPKPFCIHTRLRELYVEECVREASGKNTSAKRNSLLLEKLVRQERLNTLILNLYPGNKGYSLAFRLASRTDAAYDLVHTLDEPGNMIETKPWPYEQDELLAYFDNEQLPAYIVDLLEPDFRFLFYSGCVIAEVRDYRQSYPHSKCDIHHVLLKCTSQSILSDVNQLLAEHNDCTADDKQLLESQLILARTPSLYLEPNVSAFLSQNRARRSHQHFHTHRLRRVARKFSQLTVNRKRKLDQFTHQPGLELFEFLARYRSREERGVAKSKRVHGTQVKPVPVPCLRMPDLAPPTQPVHINFNLIDPAPDTADFLPQPMEECVLETDMLSKDCPESRVYHIKLSILQRPSNSEYLGELYLDRDYKKEDRNGVACRFSLGSRLHANKYLSQFTDIFSEGRRKSVRMKYHLSDAYKEQLAKANLQIPAWPSWYVKFNPSDLVVSPQVVIPRYPREDGAVQQAAIATGPKQSKPTITEVEINALATRFGNYAQQYEAAANQQQQKLPPLSNNPAIINRLNSTTPINNVTNDAKATLVNAITSSAGVSLLAPHVQAVKQKLLARKVTVTNQGACLLNTNNLIAVNNNNRIDLTELSSHLVQAQTVAAVAPTNYAKTTATPRLLTNASEKAGATQALVVATASSPDLPEIVAHNAHALLEKLERATTAHSANFVQSNSKHAPFTVQTVNNVVTSPPPQSPQQQQQTPPPNTISLQSLNFASLQSIAGLQNVYRKVQLPGFSQPIFYLNDAASTAMHLVSVPVTTTSASGATSQTPTTLLTSVSSPTAHLVTSGVKGLNQQGIRTTTPATLTQQVQLLTPLPRPRHPQQTVARGIKRTLNTTQEALPNASNSFQQHPQSSQQHHQQQQQQQLQYKLQKTVQIQKYPQLCQQKMRRRSNASDVPQ